MYFSLFFTFIHPFYLLTHLITNISLFETNTQNSFIISLFIYFSLSLSLFSSLQQKIITKRVTELVSEYLTS